MWNRNIGNSISGYISGNGRFDFEYIWRQMQCNNVNFQKEKLLLFDFLLWHCHLAAFLVVKSFQMSCLARILLLMQSSLVGKMFYCWKLCAFLNSTSRHETWAQNKQLIYILKAEIWALQWTLGLVTLYCKINIFWFAFVNVQVFTGKICLNFTQSDLCRRCSWQDIYCVFFRSRTFEYKNGRICTSVSIKQAFSVTFSLRSGLVSCIFSYFLSDEHFRCLDVQIEFRCFYLKNIHGFSLNRN